MLDGRVNSKQEDHDWEETGTAWPCGLRMQLCREAAFAMILSRLHNLPGPTSLILGETELTVSLSSNIIVKVGELIHPKW